MKLQSLLKFARNLFASECRQSKIRKKNHKNHPRPQAQARAALTVALVQAVEQLIVIGSFALKVYCGWKGNAG
jgi:hypothetical protein